MGYEIIGSLVCASLLMNGVDDDDGKSFVIMHDVVREMALWIASALGKQKEAFIVRAGVGLSEIPKVKNWSVVRRMSLMDNKIFRLAGNHNCTKLTTLLLQNGWLKKISSEFFNSIPKLAVLDLSGNINLSELPEEISSRLGSLQYLNLSCTDIREVPKDLQKLKKLIYFDLEETCYLSSIDGISRLNLKVLKLAGSCFHWHTTTLKELEALEHLEVLTIIIDFFGIMWNKYTLRDESLEHLVSLTCTPSEYPENFLTSHRLMSCTRFLKIKNTINLESSGRISLPSTMDKLCDLSIVGSHCNISEIKMGRICRFLSLVKVHIDSCKGLRELTFLMFAPNLRFLSVKNAKQLEDIINEEKACEVEGSGIVPFSRLNNLHLKDLPKLENIYWSPLPFPCLERIEVTSCPKLKKLPLDSKSGKQGENILFECYPSSWTRDVEWEDEATRTRFLS